jgi:hypothetical protein
MIGGSREKEPTASQTAPRCLGWEDEGDPEPNSTKREKGNRLNAKQENAEATTSAESAEAGPESEQTKRSLVRHPLSTLSGLIAEAAKVYRQARDKKLEHAEARSLVWMLAQMRGMVETQALEHLEQRLEELAPSIESKGHGYSATDRPSRTAH